MRAARSKLLSAVALLQTLVLGSPAEAGSHEVTLCHEGREISVSESAVAAHLRNHGGDRLMGCENSPPTMPSLSLSAAVVPFEADLVCVVSEPAVDANLDPITYVFEWELNGAPHPDTTATHHPGDTVPAERVEHGVWTCRARAWDGEDSGPVATATSRAALDRNVLVVVADDVGVNAIGAYGYPTNPPPTPNIDALAAEGVLFRNGYSYAACSPTRAASLTGRVVRRYGMGDVIRSYTPAIWALPLREETIPEMLRASHWGYATAAIGKWHLAHFVAYPQTNPLDQGFDFHVGTPANVADYWNWPWVRNGEWFTETRYATTASVDDALAEVERMPQPWFMWLSLNAAHKPVHVPPDHLHTQDVDPDSSEPALYRAMVEAMDTEIGRLLAGLDPVVRSETTIVFIGDNGTYRSAIDYPLQPARGAKGTLQEQGIHVPWIVASPHVTQPGRETDALVQVVDLFPTVAEIAGVDLGDRVIDGVSFASVLEDPSSEGPRQYVVVEKMKPVGPPPWRQHHIAARNARYKVWRDKRSFEERLYDLQGSPYDDGPNLLTEYITEEQVEAWLELRAELQRYESEIGFEY